MNNEIYIKEKPKSCKDCPCCSCGLKPEFIKIGDFMYCNLLKQKFRYKEERKKLKDCPLKSLYDYDEELNEKEHISERIIELEELLKYEKEDKIYIKQQLDHQKAMWNELKEWASFAQPKYITDEFIDGACSAYSNVTDKMQELEGEDE